MNFQKDKQENISSSSINRQYSFVSHHWLVLSHRQFTLAYLLFIHLIIGKQFHLIVQKHFIHL